MKRRCGRRVLGEVAGWATAAILSTMLGGCASSPSSDAVVDGAVDRPAGPGVSPDATSAADKRPAFSFCIDPPTTPLIDDMSGASISLTTPSCKTTGAWYIALWNEDPALPGTLTVPPGDLGSLSGCGSACQSLYSPLPSGFPGRVATGADGGAGPQAMCAAGQTGPSSLDGAGMVLQLGDTAWPPQTLIDASACDGIEFWLWVSPGTAAAVTSGFTRRARRPLPRARWRIAGAPRSRCHHGHARRRRGPGACRRRSFSERRARRCGPGPRR
jgi:hypothetical protein